MAKKLTQAQIDNIKAYNSGDSIVTLKNFVEMVRKRPGMYIGYKGVLGYIRMIREIYQNGLDEVYRADSPGSWLRVTCDETTKEVSVEDNGRGIPYDNIIRIFTSQHTSTNYNKEDGDYTAGTNGIGAKASNALSKYFIVQSYVLGEGREVQFIDGTPWDKGEVPIPNPEGKQGTIIRFCISEEVMGPSPITCNDVMDLITVLHPITPIGTVTEFEGKTLSGEIVKHTIVNNDGVMGILAETCREPLIIPIEFGADTGKMRFSALFSYDKTSSGADDYTVVSYANCCPTNSNESSHVKGFIAGLKSFFVSYMNKTFLASASTKQSKNSKTKKKPLSVVGKDVLDGLRAVVDTATLEPNFTGQAKDIFFDNDVEEYAKAVTEEYLADWVTKNPKELQKICKHLKEVAQYRTSLEDNKVRTATYASDLRGLPSKFVAPTKVNKEYFITEGDSAGGTMENYRVNETQGVFPIRGMLPNCFDTPIPKLLANAEIRAIIDITGGGYLNTFDINKVQWEKIIIASDADAAGAFIASLILRLFLIFMPGIVEDGRLYRSLPPLYYTVIGKGKNKKKHYFKDRYELVEYVQGIFNKTYHITTMNDKKLSSNDVKELLFNNYDYLYELNRVAGLYSVDPSLLEIYLNNRHLAPEKICEIIKQQYRFMDMVKIGGHVTCDGIINQKSSTLIMNDRTLHECSKIIDIMENNLYSQYKVNGEVCNISKIMQYYDASSPANIGRLKGLGEQDGDELAYSVVYPGEMGIRTLQRYTMESAKEEIDKIRYYDNNRNKLLEGLKISKLNITD